MAIEKSALDGFKGGREWGGGECHHILEDWFPRLLVRAYERKDPDARFDASDYEREIDDAFPVLEGLREAFTANELPDTGSSRYKIWAWPTEHALHSRPKEWRRSTSPADISNLSDAIADYVGRPWLQHNVIDGAAINALLFSSLAAAWETYKSGEAFGQPNWGHFLSEGGQIQAAFINFGLRIGRFLLTWIILPAIAAALVLINYPKSAVAVLGIWILYLVYRLVAFPARLRHRKDRRKMEEKASQTIAAMAKAWHYSCGAVINPSKLKEFVVAAEHEGATFPPALHTLIDRAIQRDATALLTQRVVTS